MIFGEESVSDTSPSAKCSYSDTVHKGPLLPHKCKCTTCVLPHDRGPSGLDQRGHLERKGSNMDNHHAMSCGLRPHGGMGSG